MLFMTNICQALMDSGGGRLKYLLQLWSFSTRVNATDEGGVASEKQNSLSTMTIILNKHWCGAAWTSSTPHCQLSNFMTDWVCDVLSAITQNISNMIEGWNIETPPHGSGILLLLMASNWNFLVFCSVGCSQNNNCCLPCRLIHTTLMGLLMIALLVTGWWGELSARKAFLLNKLKYLK